MTGQYTEKQIIDMDKLLFGDKTEQEVKDCIADSMGMKRDGFVAHDDFIKSYRRLAVDYYLGFQKYLCDKFLAKISLNEQKVQI